LLRLLGRDRLPDLLRQKLKEHGKPPSDDVTIMTEMDDSEWRIHSNNQAFTVVRQGEALSVYRGYGAVPFQHQSVHDEWNRYTSFLREFIKEGDRVDYVRLLRYIVCFDDEVVNKIESGVYGKSKDVYRERRRSRTIRTLKSWVLCDDKGIPKALNSESIADTFRDYEGWKSGWAQKMLEFCRSGLTEQMTAYTISVCSRHNMSTKVLNGLLNAVLDQVRALCRWGRIEEAVHGLPARIAA